MSEPFCGEIRFFAGDYAPSGWLLCDGALLSSTDPSNNTLFTLLGTTFGGDGVNTFALPDLRGRAPMGDGQGPGLTNRPVGSIGGSETAGLTVAQMAAHNHPVLCSTAGGNQTSATGNVWARQVSGVTAAYQSAAPDTPMAAGVVGSTGGGTPHNNMQPYVTCTYIIAQFGIFPSP
jgi:microcystin-dependent protein